MKRLIVVRHGQADGPGDNSDLIEVGKSQISDLVNKLKPLSDACRVLVIASPLPRAKQSAKIIADMLRGSCEDDEILFPDTSGSSEIFQEKLDVILDLIRRRKSDADVLILVTHSELPIFISRNFLTEELGRPLNEVWPSLQYGRRPHYAGGVLVDCETGGVELI